MRGEVDRLVAPNDALLGRFAAPSTSFPSGRGVVEPAARRSASRTARRWTSRRPAIFPLVHGVRSLALEQHVAATSTLARLEALVGAGLLPRLAATDLADALQFLMALKLEAGLAELDTGRPVSGGVRLDRLAASSATS